MRSTHRDAELVWHPYTPLQSPDPPLPVQSAEDEFLTLAKQNNTILIPTLTVLGGYLRMFQSVADRKPPVVDDPNHCVDDATMAKVNETASVVTKIDMAARVTRARTRAEKSEQFSRANLKTLVAAGVPIATGTDAGNPLTLHGPAIYAEMDAMQSAGMTPMQVIVSSTAVAAKAMGIDTLRVIDTGLDPVTAEREQWDDGNNTLAIAPRVCVAYERNVETNARLEAAGIEVLPIRGSELGSGRGGPRCMSCPVTRQPVGG